MIQNMKEVNNILANIDNCFEFARESIGRIEMYQNDPERFRSELYTVLDRLSTIAACAHSARHNLERVSGWPGD